MSSFGRSRNNIDTRLIGFPPRTTMRGGNDIAILRHLSLPAPPCFLSCTCLHLSVTQAQVSVMGTVEKPACQHRDRQGI